MCLCARVRGFSLVRLNPMSHIVSPMCLDQLSPITLCDRFCESRFVEVACQDFNKHRGNRWVPTIVIAGAGVDSDVRVVS